MAKKTSGSKNLNAAQERMCELLGQISDKVDVLNKNVTDLDKKVDLQTQKTEYELRFIRELDAKQNDILEAHHKRSDGLAKDNQLREESLRAELTLITAKIETLEAPHRWLRGTKVILIYFSAVLGVVLTALEIASKILR